MSKINFALLVIAMTFSLSATARLPYLSDWQTLYPESSSDDVSCGLCHVNPASGGQPWNAYGWEIRDAWNNGQISIPQAIQAIESFNPDQDPFNASAADEIDYGFQPGWTTGENNTWFFSNGNTVIGNEPPASFDIEELDFPQPLVNPIAEAIATSSETLDLAEIAGGFNAPVRAVKAPGIDGSLFVVEQTGKIFRVELASGTKSLFMDVSGSLVDINLGYDERGLLGLAFHPDYQSNGLLYTYQSEPVRPQEQADFTVSSTSAMNHRAMVVEHKADNPSCNSTVREQANLMIIDQPQGNHNGGDLVFDQNGFLYIALGDGGSSNDQGPGHGFLGNGRNKQNVLGSILRIDPLGSNSDNGKYGVPISNPFTANGDVGVDEIFAFGFRNPYRMSIDYQDGVSLYTGDVGQQSVEEIDLVQSGGNYGWNWKEGSLFFYRHANTGSSEGYVSTVAPPDLPSDLIDPIGQYDRDEGISVIGGYLYRGTQVSNTQGSYVFGEFSNPDGALRRLNVSTGLIEEFNLLTPIGGFVTGFGQDADQELYVTVNDQFNPGGVQGKLLKLVEAGDAVSFPAADGESAMCPPDESMCVPIKTSNGAIATICL